MPARRPFSRTALLTTLVSLTTACGGGESAPRAPDLPKQPDRWVESVTLDGDSRAKFIGATRDYVITSVSAVKDVRAPATIRVGDTVEGLPVSAILCSYHWRDASYGGEQFMWRGRWGCKAGRTQQEVMEAVKENGEKRFDYIHVTPVTLAGE